MGLNISPATPKQPNIMSEQTEKAYQKQAPIFQNKKRVVGKALKAKDQRFVKNVGLGFKTPREASEGTYIHRKCQYPRSYPHWNCEVNENESHHRFEKRLSSFHQEVSEIREKTQDPVCSHVTLLS